MKSENFWMNIYLLVAIVGAAIVIVITVLTIPEAHSQEPDSNAFGYNELMAECSIILLPKTCERFENLGEKTFAAFEFAMSILFTEGVAEANRQLERMLDDIERGFPLTKKKGIWI